MQVKEIFVKKYINLPDGQSMEISVSGLAEVGIDMELAKHAMRNVVNSGVIAVLVSEILKPIEEKYKKPVEKVALNVM
jgi:hypothetical protein